MKTWEVARLQTEKCHEPGNKWSAVGGIILNHQGRDGALIDVLHETQAVYGYLPEETLTQIAQGLGVPLSKVYGVATFYSLFTLKPKGRHIIRLCESAPCHLRGAMDVLQAIESELSIKPGQTTPDDKFTLEFTSCLGVCGVAPAMMIGDQVYGNLTPDKVKDVLRSYE